MPCSDLNYEKLVELMINKRKLLVIWLIFMFITMCFVINNKVEATNGVDLSDYRFSGSYTGNASALFFQDGGGSDFIAFANYSSSLYEPTVNNSQNKVFTANSIEIIGQQMYNGTMIPRVIADNLAAKKNTSNAFRVAQQFSVNQLSAINQLSLYLEYNHTEYYYFKVSITEADLSTTLDEDGQDNFGAGVNTSDWHSFIFLDNILTPGQNYYIIFEVENRSGFESNITLLETNYWQAQLHNSSLYNSGNTLLFNGSAWNQIQNDSWRDMLCYFDYTILVDPAQVNLQMDLNGTVCNYIRRQSQSEMMPGYEVYYRTYLQTKPTGSINLTVQLNSTIESLSIDVRIRYIYTIPAIVGQYTATPNKINWTVIYDYPYVEDIISYADNMFAYEFDWDYLEFTDQTIIADDLFTGPISFYNFSGYAAFPSTTLTFETGNVTGKFTSPNYCNAITPKVKVNSVFQTASKFEIGQDVRLEASIVDGVGNPISGGTGNINFTSPSGSVTSFSNLTANNGTLTSDEFELTSGFEVGLYTVSVLWTNGREVGCYIFQVEVASPVAPSDLMIYILIAAIVALGVVSSLLILKMKGILWGKGPLNVFISHKAEDYESYKVKDISDYLMKKKEVGSAFYFEEDLVGNIDDWMKETVPISQILVFIATQQSVKSKDCQNELKLAKDAGLDIIPVKGNDISWDDLNKIGLDRQKGIPFSDYEQDIKLFYNDLYYYVNKFKQELDIISVVLKKSRVSELNLIQIETNLSPEKIWRYSRTLIQMKKLNGVWTKDKTEFIREDEIINRIKILQNYGKLKDVTQIAKSLGIHEAYNDILEEVLKSELEKG